MLSVPKVQTVLISTVSTNSTFPTENQATKRIQATQSIILSQRDACISYCHTVGRPATLHTSNAYI